MFQDQAEFAENKSQPIIQAEALASILSLSLLSLSLALNMLGLLAE